ncbi:hypothetical protein QBC35DRAFT_287017 [Podospora australis]|uniref:Zn(2)-C6 fungal-type domain-containing protein n=1 Tax=Podospora australis TaxID=1536484 RepID=A0AAN7AGN4_9PEZI|nr:hypothetical protein QBC35DRAFT_287017 [Podospora australis]
MSLLKELAPAPARKDESQGLSPSGSGSSTTTGLPHPTTSKWVLPPRRSSTRKPACIPCKIKKIKCQAGHPCLQCEARYQRNALERCQYELTQEEKEERWKQETAQLKARVSELEQILTSHSISLHRPTVNAPQPPTPLTAPPVSEETTRRFDDRILVDNLLCPDESMADGAQSSQPGTHQPMPYSVTSSGSTDLLIQPELLSVPGGSPMNSEYSAPSDTDLGDLDTELMLQPKLQNSQANELETRYSSVYPPLVPCDADRLVGLNWAFDLAHVDSEIHATQLRNIRNSRGRVTNLCDYRLRHIEIGLWTSVLISNELAAKLISYHLMVEHSTMRLFDSDLFLDDLISGCDTYCSGPLVNAILAWTCQTYSDIGLDLDDLPQCLSEFSAQFLLVAEKMFWEAEDMNTITSAAAATILEVVASTSGNPDQAARYRSASVMICQAIGWFGLMAPFAPEYREGAGYDWNRASSHTAWGVFTHNTYTDLHACSCVLDQPPLLPLAGRDSCIGGDGVLVLIPRPSRTDACYIYECELAVIVHGINKVYHGSARGLDYPDSLGLAPTLEQAEQFYRQLLLWSAKLPLGCVRGSQNSPEAVIMHMHFHSAVVVLFQPFIQGPLQRLRLQTFTARGSACSVFNSSVDQLKRLVIIHRSNFEQEHNALQSINGAVFLASCLCQLGPSLKRNDVTQRQDYFAICISGLLNQLRQIPALGVVVEGLLVLALSSSTIKAEYAKSVMAELTKRGGNNPHGRDTAKDRIMSAHYVTDLERALVDRDSAIAQSLADVQLQGGKL